MWTIKISYQTGDSFGTEECEDLIGIEWESLDVAKENLRRIREHYEMYRELNYSYSHDTRDEIIAKYSSRCWFVTTPSNSRTSFHDLYEYSIKLTMDDGSDYRTSTGLWCGYFERLREAEIVWVDADDDNNDMKFKIH